MTKLIDAFIFFNEIELLKFRLNYLNEVVDHFIIVESNKSFTGKDKDLVIPRIVNHLPKKLIDKIIYIVVDDMPYGFTYQDNEKRERHQRCKLDVGITKLNLDGNDILMISDIDEIPDKRKLKDLKVKDNFEVCNLEFYNFCGSINHQVFSKNQTPEMWYCFKIIKYKFYKFLNLNPQTLRFYAQYGIDIPVSNIKQCGWHFSYFGGITKIKTKIENFCHQEFNNDLVKNSLEKNLKNNIGIFNGMIGSESFTKPCDLKIIDDEIINDETFYTYITSI
jgi:beta-1,4-mannosyl-glycoprotein beta-1,4-N-acetylglucosaminyltransferase